MKLIEINVFPFKSLAGVRVNSCLLNEYGFVNDRIYMLCQRTKSGWSPLTQIELPALAAIKCSLTTECLILKFDNFEVKLPLNTKLFKQDLPVISVELGGSQLQLKDITFEVRNLNLFFTNFFKQRCPQLALPNSFAVCVPYRRREVPLPNVKTKVYSNLQYIWQATLMTTASLVSLQTRIGLMSTDEVDASSFRMNLVVETSDPFEEDDWKQVKIGNILFDVVMPCERCSIPSVDPETGVTRPGKQPLPALYQFRVLSKGRAPCFGLCLQPTHLIKGAKLKVNDEVCAFK